MTKYQGYETDFQKTLARFLDQYGVVWCHVANERQTSIKQARGGRYYSPEGNKLKSMGVKKGVPDVMIFEPHGGFVGLAIELKVGSNKPTDEQKWWLAKLRESGWMTMWSNDLDDVIEHVEKYMASPRTVGLK